MRKNGFDFQPGDIVGVTKGIHEIAGKPIPLYEVGWEKVREGNNTVKCWINPGEIGTVICVVRNAEWYMSPEILVMCVTGECGWIIPPYLQLLSE